MGAELAAASADVGPTVNWNGDPNQRVELTGVLWQKRRRRSRRATGLL